MHEVFTTIGPLIGGIGLFLLAVGMITDGLKLAAGGALRDLLGKWTKSPAHGVASGMFITAMVQSSSAVTVATIGFVNAGLITMYQALGVVYGSNIGTTMTGWLVAMLGFELKIDTFALPMIGLGMLMRITGGHGRAASFGLALAGFGLFFIGIDVLKGAFEGIASGIDLQSFTLDGISGAFIYIGIGFAMTVLTQSSSAAIAITLTAATGGVLGLYAAAAMVIGANVGTTSTAAIAVIGATPNAKRVAAAHMIFNIVTGAVALVILPLLIVVVKNTSGLLGLQDIPAVTLALFHTTFNVLGVLLMWPFTDRLTRFLERRFVTDEEVESRPQYLDKTIAVSPALAVNALVLELCRVAAITRRMGLAVLSARGASDHQIRNDHLVVEKLSNEVAEFISRLEKNALNEELGEHLKTLVRVDQYLLSCAEYAVDIRVKKVDSNLPENLSVTRIVAQYYTDISALLTSANIKSEEFSTSLCAAQLERTQTIYEDVKAQLLHVAVASHTSVPQLIEILEQNSRVRTMAQQMLKATRDLGSIYGVAELQPVKVVATPSR